jgi:adenylate cyclase
MFTKQAFVRESMTGLPTSRLIVNLVFPTEHYFDKYGFSSAAEMQAALQQWGCTSQGVFHSSPPNRRWMAKRLTDAKKSSPGTIMVFIVHRGDWSRCFNMSCGAEVFIDEERGITIPSIDKWKEDQDLVARMPESIGDELNRCCCDSLFGEVVIIAFRRPGPDWFTASMKEARATKSAIPLLSAVRTQIERWHDASNEVVSAQQAWIGFLSKNKHLLSINRISESADVPKSASLKDCLVVAEPSDSALLGEIKKALPDIYVEGVERIVADEGRALCGNVAGFMFLFEKDPSEFYAKFSQLDRCDCENVVVASAHPCSSYSELDELWKDEGWPLDSIPDFAHKEFQRRCRFVGLDWTTLDGRIDEALNQKRSRRQTICGDVCEAKEIITVVGSFGHGAKSDISNALLAPARMLAIEEAKRNQDQPDIASKLKQMWDGFQDLRRLFENGDNTVEGVIKKAKETGGRIGMGLEKAWGDVCQCLDAEKKDCEKIAERCAAMMRCLTEVRVLAGIRRQPQSFSVTTIPEPLSTDKRRPDYRMLIVDDSAMSWRPVFEILRTKLCRELSNESVSIEFSTDGETLYGKSLKCQLAEFDLILLDVFIGRVHGLELLREIRTYFRWIPVLLWTTSRDIDIPAQANLANGFIFKKTATCDDIAKTILQWIEEGRAQRACTIPNRFFDQNIKSVQMRRILQKFSKWALRQLDGFHVLDPSYFLFFTDHGGRVLLETLEKLIRPLAAAGKLFSEDLAAREEEVCTLYLAALCHEMGMFPIGDEPFSSGGPDYMQRVRKLHSLRGMMLFANASQGQDFGDLTDLMSHLNAVAPTGYIPNALALLVGYHARTLKPLGPDSFGILDDDAKKKIAACSFDWLDEDTVAKTLKSLRDAITTVGRRDKLRHQCAVLRFADAIDLDRTRIPATFIMLRECEDGQHVRDASNNCEYLKRQLVREVDSPNGKVTLIMDCPNPVGCLSRLAAILDVDEGDLRLLLASPWQTHTVSQFNSIRQKADAWLAAFWRRMMMRPSGNIAVSNKPDIETDLGIIGTTVVSQNALRVVTAVGSVAVLGEIREEYQAIEDCQLTEYIPLATPVWDETRILSRNISVLSVGLEQYGWTIEDSPEVSIRRFDSSVTDSHGLESAVGSTVSREEHIEVEKKFLVTGTAWRRLAQQSEKIRQGYLTGGDTASIRVRIRGVHAVITVKSADAHETRLEYEYPIPTKDAEVLISRFCKHVVEKTRYALDLDGAKWEIDEFVNNNEGLVIAEIELRGTHQVTQYPSWIGKEITGVARYYNANLAIHPYKAWSDEEKMR